MTASGYLILRVTDFPGERGTVDEFAEPHALRDPQPATVLAAARKRGYEAVPPGARPEGWLLTIRCYTSKTKDGAGRCGSQAWSYPARRIAASC